MCTYTKESENVLAKKKNLCISSPECVVPSRSRFKFEYFLSSYFILQHTISSYPARRRWFERDWEEKKSVKLKTHHKRREFQFDTFFFLAARSLSRIWDVKTSIKLSLCFYLLAKGGKGKGKYVRISVGLFKSFNSHDTNTPHLPNDERRANRTRNEHSSDPWKTWSFSCCFWHGAALAQKWNWIHFKMSRRKKREKGFERWNNLSHFIDTSHFGVSFEGERARVFGDEVRWVTATGNIREKKNFPTSTHNIVLICAFYFYETSRRYGEWNELKWRSYVIFYM